MSACVTSADVCIPLFGCPSAAACSSARSGVTSRCCSHCATSATISAAFALVVLTKIPISVIRIFVVRKAFDVCPWCEDVSRRKAEMDVVHFYFLSKT